MPNYNLRVDHGFRIRSYEIGEFKKRYGLAIMLDDGTYEFYLDGKWGKEYASYWIHPPNWAFTHEFADRPYIRKGQFIVNFNKPKSPWPTKGIK